MATNYEQAIRAVKTAKSMSRTIKPLSQDDFSTQYVISTNPSITFSRTNAPRADAVRFGKIDNKSDYLMIRQSGMSEIEIIHRGNRPPRLYPALINKFTSTGQTLVMDETAQGLFDAGIAALNALRDSNAENAMFSDRAVVA